MTTLLLAIAVLFAVLLLWLGVRTRSKAQGSDAATGADTLAVWPPQATRVLTQAESEAYDLVRSALPAHIVLAQVPLQRFIKVPTRNSYAEWQRRVGQISADIVVCDSHSQVIAVVEILSDEDLSGGRGQRRRDRMIRVLKAAGIAVHVWRASALPSVEAARATLAPAAVLPDAESPATGVRAMPGRMAFKSGSGLGQGARSGATAEGLEMREAPPSTWFDDLDTGMVPLDGGVTPPQPPQETKAKPDR